MTAIVDGHTCKVHINCNNCTQVGNLRHVLFTNDWRDVFSTIVSNVLSTNKSSPNLSSGCALTPGTFLLLLYTKQRLNRECYWLVTWIKILIRFCFFWWKWNFNIHSQTDRFRFSNSSRSFNGGYNNIAMNYTMIYWFLCVIVVFQNRKYMGFHSLIDYSNKKGEIFFSSTR